MTDHYPQYPGDDPGRVEPPRHPPPNPPRQQPAQYPPPVWQPPPPPERPDGPLRRPGTLTAAVWTMVAGAVVTAASTLVSLMTVGYMRDTVRRDLEADPAIDDAAFVDGFVGFFGAAMTVFLVLAGLVSVCLWLWMAWKNGQGRSWARLTATVLGGMYIATLVGSGVIAVIDFLVSDVPLPSTGVLVASAALTAIGLAVSAAALVLLWLKPSRGYFDHVTAQQRWDKWSRTYGQGTSERV